MSVDDVSDTRYKHENDDVLGGIMNVTTCVSKVLIENCGIKLADGDVAFRNTGFNYVSIKMSGVLGLFDNRTPEVIYLFDDLARYESMTDYVLLHEMGHLLSCKAETEWHKQSKLMRANELAGVGVSIHDIFLLRKLSDREEAIADCFAQMNLGALGLSTDIPLPRSRMASYEQAWGSEAMAELNNIAYGLTILFNDLIEAGRKAKTWRIS